MVRRFSVSAAEEPVRRHTGNYGISVEIRRSAWDWEQTDRGRADWLVGSLCGSILWERVGALYLARFLTPETGRPRRTIRLIGMRFEGHC